jgi:hypothetical protein
LPYKLLHRIIGREVESQNAKKERINKIRQAASDIIVSYQREVYTTAPIKYNIQFPLFNKKNCHMVHLQCKVDDAGGALEEMRKGMDAAQEVVAIYVYTYSYINTYMYTHVYL